jgi:predicted MFS family arabinose efflux permease
VDRPGQLTPTRSRVVDIERSLSRSDVVICSSIGAGALLSGLLTRAPGLLGVDPLAAPLVLGLVVQVVGVVCLLVLMDEDRAGRGRGRGQGAARAAVRSVPSVMREAMTVIRRSRLLTALAIAELLWGFGMVAFETLMPPRLAEIAGGAEEAARLLGPAITAAWVFSAVGAAVAPGLARRWGTGAAACVLRVLHGLTVVGMALAAGPLGLIAAYLATYWVHGATGPLHYGMVHRAVDASHRATVVSANSLTSQVGGAVSGILLGALADATSITTAMLAAAAVLGAAGPLYLVGRGDRANVDEAVPALNVG